MKLFFFLLMLSIAPALACAEETWTNSLGMRFISIPAGSFYMGSCALTAMDVAENAKRKLLQLPPQAAHCIANHKADSDAKDDESPQHLVRFKHDFQLSQHEVTLGQFKRFIMGAGRTDLIDDEFTDSNSYGEGAPVVMVSWNQTLAFISWLNQQEGGHHYRLPTEAEWEYAARAGSKGPWSFQGKFSTYAWYQSNADGHQHPVGSKKKNPWGLHDMHGNVWEWVADWYDADFYQNSPEHNPIRQSSGDRRVARGGGWNHPSHDLRSANRGDAQPQIRYAYVGFRLVRDSK